MDAGIRRFISSRMRRAAALLSMLCAAHVATTAYSAELTVADGVVVKFAEDAQLAVRDRVNVGRSVVFTSHKDDQAGGPVAPTAQTPGAGDWRGIRQERSSTAFGASSWSDSTIRFAGASEGAALELRGVSPSLQYLQLADSTVALRLVDSAPTITGSAFLRNSIGVDKSGTATLTISNSVFELNTTYGVLNQNPTVPVQATGNWWGHISGPRDTTANPQGQGDAVSAGVNYANFLASAPLLNPTIRLAAPATYFDTRVIQLDLACVNAVDFRIAEGTAFAGVPFQSLTNGRASVNYTVSAGDGRKTLNAQFRNSSGVLVTAGLNGGVLIDSELPTLAITNPAAGSVITGSITVEASASDGSGINRVQFYVDGQLRQTDTSAPYSYQWNNESNADGNYSIRVVAVDEAGRTTERTNGVTLARASLPPDVEGPALANIRFNGSTFAEGATVTRSGTITVGATDRSGVVRVELLLDGAVVATASGTGTYSIPFDIANVANGAHALSVRALDSLNNVTTTNLNITVAHAAPDAPRITDPASAFTTRYAALTVLGTAQAGKNIQVLINGQPHGTPLPAGADGRFSIDVTLSAGANQIRATAADQYGTSAPSGAVTVTLDTAVPSSPSNLVAQAQASGRIRLSWTASSDPNATGYFLYRATQPFDALNQAVRVNSSRTSNTLFEDLPPQDGVYHYRAVAVNSANTPSDPSNSVQVTSDATLPRAVTIAYTPRGRVDSQTGRVGQGQVDVVLTVSEALQATPYFSVVPQGGAPLAVDLTKSTDTEYRGSFVVDAQTPSGMTNALFSARDLVGNRGTAIDAGASLNIDTAGPELAGVALTPTAPIRTDSASAVTAVLTLSKPMRAGETPQLSYQLTGGPSRLPASISSLSQTNPTTWQASFNLPGDAGQNGPETLSFLFRGIDDLDNVSTRITAPNRFQVYRGELPPADVPLGFAATAQPAGRVRLAWLPVTDATAYQIYRQGPNDSSLQPHVRASGESYIDQAPQDGSFRYAIASVRQSNGQESLSDRSPTVEVIASASAPGAPENLALVLTGQGIRASWQPPPSSTVATYNLYRATGTSIGSIEGLTPLKTGITQPITVDANPSTTEHAYVVTALDAAGNESAISNSAYLNAQLLPVATLRVDQLGNDLPVLTWTASRSSGVAGYNVYVGPDNALVKLNPSPIGSLSLTDTGYTSGERRYTVAAVDSNGIEMPRSIVLPNVSAQIASGLPIQRGVMNRLQVQLANTSGAVADARVVVRMAGIDHRSEPFSLGANETRLVPVVVGGYADLPGQAQAQIGVEIVPNEGEIVRVAQNTNVDVTDGSLVVGIATEEFTRGGVGRVRLTIENTTDVEVELLTARSSGNADSDELRFKILDVDGNVLASQPYRQVFGANVVTLPNGQTVARIAPGAAYTSDVFNVNVPASSPDQIRVRLEVDRIRYRSGQPDQVLIAGRGSERTVTLADTVYTGEVTQISPVSSFGDQDVIIQGRAVDRASGAALPNTKLTLVLNQQGFEKTYSVFTDGSGEFVYTFIPTATDAGVYRVSAVHPDITDRPEQRAFTINRVVVGPTPFRLDVPRNYPYSIRFTAAAGAGTQATNVRFALNAASQPTGSLPVGVTVQLPPPVSITPRQTLNLPVQFVADNSAQPSGSLVLDAYADEHPNTPIGQVRVNYTLAEARPFLTATPSFVETGMARGTSTVESVEVGNKGLQDALDLDFSLTNVDGTPAPAWAAIASAVDGTLAVGETRTINLSFTPPASTAEGVYQFRLRVRGTNITEQNLNVFASVTQSGVGNTLFRAADIYTATVDRNGQLIQGLRGARITVQNEDVISVTQEQMTDQLGEALFVGLPAGRYKYKATAANHQEVAGRFQIKPGVTLNQSVFLDMNLVTVEWTVREITIQDRYEIILNATFETDVPAAVVMLEPASVNLPKMNPGDIFYGELVLTNHGLVRADNVVQELPNTDEFFRYEFLTTPPASLEAKQRVRLPYRIVSLKSLDGGGAASGAGCYSYSQSTRIKCTYTCANGTVSKSCGAGTSWFSASNSSCPTGGGSGGGGGGGGGGGTGGWGGWSGPGGGYGELSGLPPCTKCNGICCEGSGGGGGGDGGGDDE